MLTKEHLKYRIRQGRIKPILAGEEHTQDTQELLDIWQLQAVGCRVEEMLSYCDSEFKKALHHLMVARSSLSVFDESSEDHRWQALYHAETIRSEVQSLEEYQDRMVHFFGQGALYADLPALRKIIGFEPITSSSLLNIYNISQIQGLLLRTKECECRLSGLSLSQQRLLLRMLRFFGLTAGIGEKVSSDTDLYLKISGPLSLFQHQAPYGMKLASFFPYLLMAPRFQIEAVVQFVAKPECQLKVDQTLGLRYPYSLEGSYIPPELQSFGDSFQKKYGSEWDLSFDPSPQVLPGGGRMIPDFVIQDLKSKRTYFFELFHRWHKVELEKRLKHIDHPGLVIGVDKKLDVKKEGLFHFNDFPTTKQLANFLQSKREMSCS